MDHAARRRRLVAALHERGVTDGRVLLVGHRPAVRDYAADHYPFRQDASFTYFIGLDRPGAAATIDIDDATTTLYVTPPGADDELWDGPRRGIDPGLADRIADIATLDETVATGSVLTLPAARADQHRTVLRLLGADHRPSAVLVDAVAQLRTVKDADEVASIGEALERTARLHRHAMAIARPGVPVEQVARSLRALAAGEGWAWAYPLICTKRGEILHDLTHHGVLETGDLLLIDAGVQSSAGYASDVTRTLPIGGFDAHTRLVHEAVLAAQHLALDLLAPGVRHLDVHMAVGRLLLEHLADAGLVRGDLDAAAEAGAFGVVFPHGLGHLLGIETHDMEGLGEDAVGYDTETPRSEVFGPSNLRYGKRLRAGTVITVEPGVYFHGPLIERFRTSGRFADLWNWHALADWVGIGGVRIEDVALVTADGAEVLGPPIPKRPDELPGLTPEGRGPGPRS